MKHFGNTRYGLLVSTVEQDLFFMNGTKVRDFSSLCV